MALVLVGIPVAERLTEAAGSPPVHSADVDVLVSFPLFLVGAFVALCLVAVTRMRSVPAGNYPEDIAQSVIIR